MLAALGESFFKNAQHLFGELIAVPARIQEQTEPVSPSHNASLAFSRANPARVSCFMRSSSDLQLPAARRRQPIGLLLARGVFLLEALDPAVLEQPPQRAKQRAGAHADAAAAQYLDVLDQRVAVAGMIGQAGENQQDRLGEGLGFELACLRHVA